MPSSSWLNPHKPLLWVMLVALAAAFFASGALVARATLNDDDDSNTPFAPDTSVGERPANTGAPSYGYRGPTGPGNTPAGFPGANPNMATEDGDAAGGMDATAYGRSGYWGGCRAPLPAGILGANGVDLDAVNFEMNVPGSGFTLLSFSLTTYAECDANGQPAPTGELVLDTAWRHDETKLEAYVSQRLDSEAEAAILRDGWATFSLDGYVYSVSVNGWGAYPVDATRDIDLPYPDRDPRTAEVLNQLLGQLAPSIGLQCFWTEADGDWSDVIAMGLGDPRSAIPAGYSQSDLWVTTFNEPASGCDSSVRPVESGSFSAGWSNSDGSYIGVSAWGIPADYPNDYPGQVSSWGANWSNANYQFSVYVSNNGREGDLETVRAIARALDGSYNEQCFIRESTLTDADLPGLGFNIPALPDGYEITRTYHSGTDIAAGCDKPDGFAAYYNLSWTLSNGPDTIDVSVSRYDGSSSTGEGWISDYGVNWSGTNGDYFSVNAWSKGVSPTVSRDILLEVAQSLDPNLDVSKLKEESTSGGGTPPRPLADPESRSAEAGAASTDASR